MAQPVGIAPIVEWVPRLAALPGIRLLVVALSIVGGVALARLVVRIIGRRVAQQFSRQSVAQTVIRGVHAGTVVAAFLTGLRIVGFRFTDLLIGTAVLSAVVGIILAPLVGNFINGVFVLADQPFEIGDMVELDDGTQGFVEDITIRYTKILTLDNTFLVVPNGTMRERDVTNYSAEDERTRQTIDLLVTYECDVSQARRLVERAARDCEAVVNGGPDIRIGVARYVAGPDCRIHEFADDGVLLRLRYWIQTPYKLGKVQSDVNTRIRERLADADVTMAYPHRHLVFDDTSGTAAVGIDRSGRTPDAAAETGVDATSTAADTTGRDGPRRDASSDPETTESRGGASTDPADDTPDRDASSGG